MTDNLSEGGEHRLACWRDEAEVRREFQATGSMVWIELVAPLARRWDDPRLARQVASRQVRTLSGLVRLRCLPDGRPSAAALVFGGLCRGFAERGRTTEEMVARTAASLLAGEARSAPTPGEIAALGEAFLRCYAADCERGEVTWVDELYNLAASDPAEASWAIQALPARTTGEDAAVTLHIPWAALEAAGLRPGDRLVVEPRSGGPVARPRAGTAWGLTGATTVRDGPALTLFPVPCASVSLACFPGSI